MEVKSRVDVLNGKAFGNTGPYEKIWGKAYFAIDPAHPRNQVIADLGLAPRNAAGKVEFSADLFILKPKDPGRGNGVVFFDVVNRGRFRLLSTFSGAAAADDPTEAAHFGDGSLLNNGYTLVAVGWQFDVPDELIGVQAPIATNNGTAIKGWLREWFISDKATDSFEWTGGNSTRGYLPVDLNAVRLPAHGARRDVCGAPTDTAGRLAVRPHARTARHVADPNYLTLKGGFKPGLTYELAYESQNPPVAGVGFAAVRDMASAMKYQPASSRRAGSPTCTACRKPGARSARSFTRASPSTSRAARCSTRRSSRPAAPASPASTSASRW